MRFAPLLPVQEIQEASPEGRLALLITTGTLDHQGR